MTVVTKGTATIRQPSAHGWTRPGERTTDEGQYLTSRDPVGARLQLRAQCRMFAGFLFADGFRAPEPKSWRERLSATPILVKRTTLR